MVQLCGLFLGEIGGQSILRREDGKSFRGWTDFCLTPQPFGLGRSPQDIEQIIQEAKDPKTIAEKAILLAEHRRPTKEEQENKSAHRTFNRGQGLTP
jgi:hypothetical protein